MTPLSPALLESVAAAAVREGLADALFTRVSTPIGRLLVVQGEDGIVRVGFQEEPEDEVLAQAAAVTGPRLLASDRELAATREAFDAYFAGEGDPHALPVEEVPAAAGSDAYDDGGFEALIAPLPDSAQTALRLRFVDDLDYEGIAARLGCSPVAARQRVSTAVRTLRERHAA